MERTMTVEERIRRAEEIYERRKRNEGLTVIHDEKDRKEKNEKKDIKLLKKMLIQLLVCICIYLVIYTIQNKQYIFSEDFINKVNEIISYDIDFRKVYEDTKNYIMGIFSKENEGENQNEESNETNVIEDTEINNGIGGAVEENVDEPQQAEETQSLSQEEQDILNVKNTTSFIKPVEGTISSIYGYRETATGNVPKDHTGTDIAAVTGTKIKSATDGQVVLVSEEGDYGKHIKVQIGEVSIIYAHCNALYVKEGDMVTQGQEIAEVGATGNSTGPHLHFEIRISERTVDPQKILEL